MTKFWNIKCFAINVQYELYYWTGGKWHAIMSWYIVADTGDASCHDADNFSHALLRTQTPILAWIHPEFYPLLLLNCYTNINNIKLFCHVFNALYFQALFVYLWSHNQCFTSKQEKVYKQNYHNLSYIINQYTFLLQFFIGGKRSINFSFTHTSFLYINMIKSISIMFNFPLFLWKIFTYTT